MVGLDKSMIVELPRDLKDVVVSNPANLDAVVQTSNRVFLIGKKVGDANVFFFDENGEQVLMLEVRVERDMKVFDRMVDRLIPGAHVEAEIINDTIVLSGSVVNAADSARASELAARFMIRPGESTGTAPAKVINMLRVEAKEQVMLKVTIAEVQRDAVKRIGINWSSAGIGDSALAFGTNLAFPVSAAFGKNTFLAGAVGPSAGLSSCAVPSSARAALTPGNLSGVANDPRSDRFTLPGGPLNCLAQTFEAFERSGLMKTLAEPTLAAISGESASFLAGGEFPVPVGQSNSGAITIQFKPFGVGLSFSPLVLSEGRINLKVATEVSELTNEGAVTLGSVAIPALKVRRANTTVELPSGGSLVIGGLIKDDTRQNIDGIPGLKTLPILGAMFRSRDFMKKETELVVLVTPYLVNAVNRGKLALPTDNLDTPSDNQAVLIGQLNRVYGNGRKQPHGKYHGTYGFIVE